MVPFTVVVRHEVRNRAAKMTLTQRDHAVEAFLLDRPNEPLGVRVGVSGQLHRRRAVRRKPFELSILSIRCTAGRSS
jgi:hypothetical protein